MKNMEIKKILTLLIFAIAIAGIIAPASAAVDSTDNNKVYSIESKEKTVSNKITWNANGGKIGTKSTVATNVKKGSKIGKLPTTPKRSGYTFNGWYTKKTGGTKITANTKPTKSISYYAQWKKQKTLNADEKVLVGKYLNANGYVQHEFKADGTYLYYGVTTDKANWAVTTKGTVRITNYGGDKSYDRNWYYMFDKVDGKSGIRFTFYGEVEEAPFYPKKP